MKSRHCSRACAAAVEMMEDGTGVQTERPGTPINAHGRTPTTAEYQGLVSHVCVSECVSSRLKASARATSLISVSNTLS